jgi:hypothetical protein
MCEVTLLREDEYGHKGIDKNTLIKRAVVDSGDYRRKYDNATENPKVNKALYDSAKFILNDRSGSHYESMRWIDGNTGKIIASFDSMGRLPELTGEEHEMKVEYGANIINKLKGYNNIIVIHNHPNSTAPSAGDLNSACDRGYSLGFVACHDGRVFKYRSNQKISLSIYDTYWADYRSEGLEVVNAQMKAIQKIANNSDIYVTEVNKNGMV